MHIRVGSVHVEVSGEDRGAVSFVVVVDMAIALFEVSESSYYSIWIHVCPYGGEIEPQLTVHRVFRQFELEDSIDRNPIVRVSVDSCYIAVLQGAIRVIRNCAADGANKGWEHSEAALTPGSRIGGHSAHKEEE
jgi:hypothetical protein